MLADANILYRHTYLKQGIIFHIRGMYGSIQFWRCFLKTDLLKGVPNVSKIYLWSNFEAYNLVKKEV